MNSHEVFIHIHQGCFAVTGAIVRLPQCQWSKPDGYGKISQCITTTKPSKAKTVCIFLGIYCTSRTNRWHRKPTLSTPQSAPFHDVFVFVGLRSLPSELHEDVLPSHICFYDDVHKLDMVKNYQVEIWISRNSGVTFPAICYQDRGLNNMAAMWQTSYSETSLTENKNTDIVQTSFSERFLKENRCCHSFWWCWHCVTQHNTMDYVLDL